MSNRNKKIKFAQLPTHKKEPKTAERDSFYDLHPSWQISLLEMHGHFGWQEVNREKLDQIRCRLVNLEKQTWNEILVGAKKQFHPIACSTLSKLAQDRLRELKLDDIEQVYSFRLTGRERIFGILQRGILILLWWDPDHRVCPSELKHT